MSARALFFLFLFCLSGACKKYNPYFTNKGVITNYNFRVCLCVASCPCGCGGPDFHFTDMNDTSRIIIENNIIQLPAGTVYPVYLTVDWQNTSRCGVRAMRVVSYQLQQRIPAMFKEITKYYKAEQSSNCFSFIFSFK